MKEHIIYYTYILLCCDGTLYTGYTDDLVRRVRAHNCGRGAKYTRSRTPVRLIYWEKFAKRSKALEREYALKQWTRAEKLALLEEKREWVEGCE